MTSNIVYSYIFKSQRKCNQPTSTNTAYNKSTTSYVVFMISVRLIISGIAELFSFDSVQNMLIPGDPKHTSQAQQEVASVTPLRSISIRMASALSCGSLWLYNQVIILCLKLFTRRTGSPENTYSNIRILSWRKVSSATQKSCVSLISQVVGQSKWKVSDECNSAAIKWMLHEPHLILSVCQPHYKTMHLNH